MSKAIVPNPDFHLPPITSHRIDKSERLDPLVEVLERMDRIRDRLTALIPEIRDECQDIDCLHAVENYLAFYNEHARFEAMGIGAAVESWVDLVRPMVEQAIGRKYNEEKKEKSERLEES